MNTLAALLLLAAGPYTEDGHLDPGAFEFVQPGVTRAEVDERLGEPWLSSISVVAAGKIDLFVDEAPLEQSPGAPQASEDVHYYEYRPEEHVSEVARIVFKANGEVWYALLPPRPTETSVQKASARYGRPFVSHLVERNFRHRSHTVRVHRIPQLGVGLMEEPVRGITHRLVFPPTK